MSEEKRTKLCPQCQTENDEKNKFCSNCGAQLASPAPVEDAVVETAPVVEEISSVETSPVVEEIPPVKTGVSTYGDIIGTTTPVVPNVQPAPAYTQTTETTYTAPVNPTNGNVGIAIASMVCGILSILCCCLNIISIIIGVVGIILGIVTLVGHYDGKGMAIAGIITGGFGATMWIFLLASGIFAEMLSVL